MMQDLIKTFTTYAGPDIDAQRKQYQRMLDLTRSAANACAGLYDKQWDETQTKERFIALHLAELKALAYSNDRNGIKAKYCRFQTAIQQYRQRFGMPGTMLRKCAGNRNNVAGSNPQLGNRIMAGKTGIHCIVVHRHSFYRRLTLGAWLY